MARLTAPVERQSERQRVERRPVDAASFAGVKKKDAYLKKVCHESVTERGRDEQRKRGRR
jgi:hypothetical protein